MDLFHNYLDTLERIKGYLQQHKNPLDETYNAAEEITNVRYAKGGELIHRGYYCPSLIVDWLTGNVSRGRLCKRVPVNDDYTYKYFFNKHDRLTCVHVYGNGKIDPHELFTVEHILPEDNLELGFSYRWDKKESPELSGPFEISEVIFQNGLPQQYTFARCNELIISNMNLETYIYDGNYLKEASSSYAICKNLHWIKRTYLRSEIELLSDNNGTSTAYECQDRRFVDDGYQPEGWTNLCIAGDKVRCEIPERKRRSLYVEPR